MKRYLATCAIIFAALAVLLGAGPETKPATDPTEPVLNPRQQNLLLQLSDAEANIQAVNKALVLTGYKVGLAYNQIDSNLKGNELMDRNGGGPVRWDQFYGKTAIDFYHSGSVDVRYNGGRGYTTYDAHVTGSRLTAVKRPSEFDFIYRANNDQMQRAEEQIGSLLKNQSALLARRQKHEADQSRLWATIAFEQVRDRDISDESLCRFQLKGAAGHSDAQLQAIRAAVLYLRTADALANDDLDLLETNQSKVFTDIDARMKAAFTKLRTSMADALLASDVTPDDTTRVEQLKTVSKRLFEECTVVADNYRNALDRDQAKEDNSKLQFRAALQESLAAFAANVAELDGQIAQTVKAWDIQPQKGVPVADIVGSANTPAVVKVTAPAPPANPDVEKSAHVESGPAALVHFDSGETELGIINDGVKSFTNRDYEFQKLPPVLAGKTVTRRAGGKATGVQIDVPAGATIYLLMNSDADSKDKVNPNDKARVNAQLESSGWLRLADCEYSSAKKASLAVYKQSFSSQQHLTLTGIGFTGFIVAADNLKLVSADSKPAAASPQSAAKQSPPAQSSDATR